MRPDAEQRWRITSHGGGRSASTGSTCGLAEKSAPEHRGHVMTRDVYIIGTGQTPVGEHWGLGLRDLAAAAVGEAIPEAPTEGLYTAYAGKILGGCGNCPENVASLGGETTGSLP